MHNIHGENKANHKSAGIFIVRANSSIQLQLAYFETKACWKMYTDVRNLVYQPIPAVNTPPGKKCLQNHSPLGKNLVQKSPRAPPLGQIKNTSLSRGRFSITQIFDDILIQKAFQLNTSFGSICFKNNIITVLIIQYRCFRRQM